MSHDVFISFSFSDQGIAEDIVNKLTSKYGISCWICTRNIDGGKRFKSSISEAIQEAKVVVFLQSEHSVISREIPREIGIALDADKTIIPFKLDQAQLQGDMVYDLQGVQYIDATVPTPEQRIDDLAKSISKATNKPLKTDAEVEVQKPALKSSKMTCSEIFAGRDGLMEDIHAAFEDRNVIFLHGMGGIGKSELARQYWKKHRDFYTTVVFARYDSSIASLIADDKVFSMDGVARKTKEGNTPQTDEEYALDKLTIMKNTADEHTLVIIDNFDVSTKEDPFFETAISALNCRILVTTRCEPSSGDYYVIPVGEIDDATLKKLFIQYANPKKTDIKENDSGFDEILRLTNRHTYTLELVAKFMEGNDNIDYLDEMIQFLKDHGFGDIEVDGYDNICKLFRFTSLDESEKYFLRCLALMPPAGINQRLFKKWIGSGFSVRSRLVDLSLVKINGESRTIALHPVVREVVFNELHPSYSNCKDFVDRCAMVGEDAIPLMWSLPQEEKQILLACYANLLKTITDITIETYPLYVNISYMYNFVGEYASAIALHERIYAFVCGYFGKETNEAMRVVNLIAWKNSNYHLYEKALPYYEAAADWFYHNPRYDTRESHDVFRSCADVCTYIYQQKNDKQYLEKSHKYLQMATEYGEQMLEHTADRSDQFRLYLKYQIDCTSRQYFKLYLAEGKYELAEECLNKLLQAVKWFEKATSTPNADMLSYYRGLSHLKYATGCYSEALDAQKEAYRLYLCYFSAQNAMTIRSLEDLARCCAKLNDFEEAEKYLSLAIKEASALFTENHPSLVRLYKLQEEIKR